MDIPNTVLADIAAYFDLNENCNYRRVSQNWRLVLSKVFTTNPLSVSVTKLQHKHLLYAAVGVYHSYNYHLPQFIESWFTVQKIDNRGWGIFFYGIGQTYVNGSGGGVLGAMMENIKKHAAEMETLPRFWLWTKLRLSAWNVLNMHIYPRLGPFDLRLPPTCRVILKDCWLAGIDWIRLLPQEKLLIKTLLSIHITEMEHVSIGYMCKGHRGPVVDNFAHYIYGKGEAERFSAELLRLGHKYVKPVTAAERHELDTMLHYYYLNQVYLTNFPGMMDDIIRTHEPELGQAGLLPHALEYLYRDFIGTWKLKPLTERLLLALSTDCHSV